MPSRGIAPAIGGPSLKRAEGPAYAAGQARAGVSSYSIGRAFGPCFLSLGPVAGALPQADRHGPFALDARPSGQCAASLACVLSLIGLLIRRGLSRGRRPEPARRIEPQPSYSYSYSYSALKSLRSNAYTMRALPDHWREHPLVHQAEGIAPAIGGPSRERAEGPI